MQERRFSTGCEHLLRSAQAAALELGHGYVGCEHLLLAMAREEDDVPGRALRAAGVEEERLCALITRTRETAIAEGSYDLMSEDRLRLSYLTAGNQVVVGDTVETSGRGGAFPKGIMIGTVESVQPEETGISYYAVLRPFVNVSNVSSVSIITDFTDTTE